MSTPAPRSLPQVGDLQRGAVDIGWANLFINAKRSKVMDYTAPYREDYMCFLVREEMEGSAAETSNHLPQMCPSSSAV